MPTEIDEEWEKEAEDGDAYAQYVIAWCYLNQKDNINAIKWVEKSANQGYYEAEVLLVSLCSLDDIVEIKPMMISERVRWDLKDFTFFDVASTEQRLADLYFKGIGVEKNQETAMRCPTEQPDCGRFRVGISRLRDALLLILYTCLMDGSSSSL